MCGRFTLTTPAEIVEEFFGLADRVTHQPRYNIAPTQQTLIVRKAPERAAREAAYVQWGLIPSWAKDRAIASKLINARGETVAEKPSFRAAFKQRRCLVVADGFYEWRAAAAKGASKQPYWISSADGKPMGFAGLWERWSRDADIPVESCTIITTTPNTLMEPIHKRMPVILEPSDFPAWLDMSDARAPALKAVQNLLRPCDSARLRARAVDLRVNDPRNDDASCITPRA